MALNFPQLVKSIMVSITAAAAEPDLEQEAKPYARSIARHCGMLTDMHTTLQSAQQAAARRADAEDAATALSTAAATAAAAAGILSPSASVKPAGASASTGTASPGAVPATPSAAAAASAQHAAHASGAVAKTDPSADAVAQPGQVATPQPPPRTGGYAVGTPGGRPQSAKRPAAPHSSRLLDPLVYVEALMEVNRIPSHLNIQSLSAYRFTVEPRNAGHITTAMSE